MEELRKHFITTERPYKEGAVEVFQQIINEKEIKKASLYITALGIYDVLIDDKEITKDLFKPGFTYYPLHLQYDSYDVTSFLKEGSVLKIELAQGWYCGRFTFENNIQIYGERPAVSWILEIDNDSQKHFYYSDDEDVKAISSPYIYAGLYDGEIYDGSGNKETIYKPIPFIGKIPENIEPAIIHVQAHEEISIKELIEKDDVTIIDFGQNFAGFIEINPKYMDGEKLKIRHGEILNKDGSLYTANLRKAKAEIVYTKTDDKIYRPKYTYMGFRYIELSGVSYKEGLLKAFAIYSSMKQTGHFYSENKMVDRLFNNQLWSMRSNYVEVPTDCPQRDERMGYTGDGQVFAHTAMYNYDVRDFWKKFLKDIRYTQKDNKEAYVPSTVPAKGRGGIGFLTMLGWSSCNIIVPDKLYRHYNQEDFISEQYESMKKLMDCEIKMTGIFHLSKMPNLGDWLSPGKDMKFMAMHHGPVSNSFIINDLKIMIKYTEKYGDIKKHKEYIEALNKIKKAYVSTYISKQGKMKDDYQGAYVMALAYVIEKDEPIWKDLYKNLVKKLKNEGIGTGFFATEHLLPMLCDNGDSKLAFDLLLNENYPGWMYTIKNGATSIWERWDGLKEDGSVNEEKSGGDNMVSFNHYAFGSVGEFYYRYILGIKELENGFKKVLIRPYTDSRLKEVSGTYESVSGKIKSAWKYVDKRIMFDIETEMPATVVLPNGKHYEVEKGIYHFEVEE